MFQHTGRHIKRRPMCCPETEGVTPLLFELSAINGGVSTEKEIWWSCIRQQAWALAPWLIWLTIMPCCAFMLVFFITIVGMFVWCLASATTRATHCPCLVVLSATTLALFQPVVWCPHWCRNRFSARVLPQISRGNAYFVLSRNVYSVWHLSLQFCYSIMGVYSRVIST